MSDETPDQTPIPQDPSVELKKLNRETMLRPRDLEGKHIEIHTEGGVLAGAAVVVLDGNVTVEVDPNTLCEIAMGSVYASEGRFLYKLLRKQPDGSWKIDETPTPGQTILLGGDRISQPVKKVKI